MSKALLCPCEDVTSSEVEHAIEKGYFKDQIAPFELKTRKGVTLFDRDEHPRADASVEGMAKLRAVFKKDGSVTPGNASGINDGAAAVVLILPGGSLLLPLAWLWRKLAERRDAVVHACGLESVFNARVALVNGYAFMVNYAPPPPPHHTCRERGEESERAAYPCGTCIWGSPAGPAPGARAPRAAGPPRTTSAYSPRPRHVENPVLGC